MQRQALYACGTCMDQTNKLAGVCLACSLTCHDGHTLYELYTKRNFRCDCGNSLFAESSKCHLFLVCVLIECTPTRGWLCVMSCWCPCLPLCCARRSLQQTSRTVTTTTSKDCIAPVIGPILTQTRCVCVCVCGGREGVIACV